MREIKFRGKSDDDWVYGLLIKSNECDFEHPEEYIDFLIQTDELKYGEHLEYFITDNNTIGQYTGLKDKNGKEIYEGDIFSLGDKKILYIVEWKDTGLRGRQIGNSSTVGLEYWKSNIEVIGNIWDNPELLGKE